MRTSKLLCDVLDNADDESGATFHSTNRRVGVKNYSTQWGIFRECLDTHAFENLYFNEGSITLIERFRVLRNNITLFVKFCDQCLNADPRVCGLAVHER